MQRVLSFMNKSVEKAHHDFVQIKSCRCHIRCLHIKVMKILILKIFAVFLIIIGAGAFAQDRETPQKREQVQLSFAPLVKRVTPAVVNIYTKRIVTRRVSPFMSDPFFERFFGKRFKQGFGGLDRKQVESALGSGVIIEPSGVVVTNAHVVKDATEISVVLSDGREFDATLSLIDEASDLAILRTDTKGTRLPFAPLRPSEDLEVGDIVLAIGNPFGVGQTVTSGIVSALARSSLNINDFNFFIQTDAAINPGNSGGALVAMDGGVVGINTAIYSRGGGSMGIGFAIPSEMVATVVAAEKAQKNGESKGVVRPWIGLSAQQVTSDIAESLGLNRPAGLLVTKLHDLSPAKKAGIEVGDVILKINNYKIRGLAEMKFRLATVPLGDIAKIDVLRKSKAKSFSFVAMAPPDEPPRNETKLEGNHPLGGAKVARLNPALSVELGKNSESSGIVVISVKPRTRAAKLVRPGDILVSINDGALERMRDLERGIKQADRANIFSLVIERDGRRSKIVLR